MADELKKRSGGFAEGMVVMACPVLVTIALGKVDLKVYGHHALFAMLAMAGITLIIGICPFLVCWFSGIFPGVNPVPVTAILATISSCSLLILACFIAQFVVSKKVIIAVGIVSGFLALSKAVFYYYQEESEPYPIAMDKILNQSHEFLTGVTGVLFLGLEGLALEGHDDPMFEKDGAVAVASFIVCAAGVWMMYFEMTPPTHFTQEGQIVHLTLLLDSTMAVGTLVLLTAVVHHSLGLFAALWLLAPPFLIFVVLVCRVAIDWNNHNPVNDVEDPPSPVAPAVQDVQLPAPDAQLSAPASLELTRVIFAGFLAVSITVISNIPPSKLTGCFLLFAAEAIVFGLSWRLLSQTHVRSSLDTVSPDHFDSSANLASLGTHVCIVIATVLLLVVAWIATENHGK